MSLSVSAKVHGSTDVGSCNYGQRQYMSFMAHWVNVVPVQPHQQLGEVTPLPPPRCLTVFPATMSVSASSSSTMSSASTAGTSHSATVSRSSAPIFRGRMESHRGVTAPCDSSRNRILAFSATTENRNHGGRQREEHGVGAASRKAEPCALHGTHVQSGCKAVPEVEAEDTVEDEEAEADIVAGPTV